jgi:hypothetical protein
VQLSRRHWLSLGHGPDRKTVYTAKDATALFARRAEYEQTRFAYYTIVNVQEFCGIAFAGLPYVIYTLCFS